MGFAPFLGMLPDTVWRVMVRWEQGESPDLAVFVSRTVDDSILLAGQLADSRNPLAPDEWDDVVLHEHGHFLARKGYFGYIPPENAPDSCLAHDIEFPLECPPGTRLDELAWEEGWCHFVAAMLDSIAPDRFYRDRGVRSAGSSGGYEFDLETGVLSVLQQDGIYRRDTLNAAGAHYEATNAATLWDIVDTDADNPDADACADAFSLPLPTILATLETVAERTLATSSYDRVDRMVDLYRELLLIPLVGDLAAIQALGELMCEHGFWGQDSLALLLDPSVQTAPPGLTVRPAIGAGPFLLQAAVGTRAAPAFAVHDIAGRRAWRGFGAKESEERWVARWDGVDARGGVVKPGVYFASCETARERWTRTLVVRR